MGAEGVGAAVAVQHHQGGKSCLGVHLKRPVWPNDKYELRATDPVYNNRRCIDRS